MALSKLLFGELALKKGLVTEDQVHECLEIQQKLKQMGITKTLGAVMHDKKYLSMVEIKEILREMTGTKDWNAIEGYQIIEKLGKGGMGSVYKARHTALNKLVALKVLPPDLASDEEYLDRFWREARAAAKLNHPNIVQALDVGESFGYHYFVMEYVDGATVKDLIERDGCLSEAKALHIVAQVAEALVHAWKNDLVHRDIKPSNIIVNRKGIAKLCDLGLAKSVVEEGSITQTGVIMGTPFYLSPEQARSEALDARSDIYSLGVTLFHMITGQVPFTGNTAATILYKHIFMDPPKASTLNPRISQGTGALVNRLLSKSPDDRPRNPQVLLDETCALLRTVSPDLVGSDGRLAPLGIEEEEALDETRGRKLELDSALVQERESNARTDTSKALRLQQASGGSDTGTLGVSGPTRSPADHGTTGGTSSALTSELTGGFQKVQALKPVRQSRYTRPAMAAACVAGLLALGGLLLSQLAALEPATPDAIALDVEGLFDATVRGPVAAKLDLAATQISEGAYGEAAEALLAVRQRELNAAEQVRLNKLQAQVRAEAVTAFAELNAEHRRLTADADIDPVAGDAVRRQIDGLGLTRIAALLETEADVLRALADPDAATVQNP